MFNVSFSVRSRLFFNQISTGVSQSLRFSKFREFEKCSLNEKKFNSMFKNVYLKVQLVNQALCEIRLFICRLHNGRSGKSSNKSNSSSRKTNRGQQHHRSTPSDQQGAASKQQQQQPMNVAPPSANQIEQKAQENEKYKWEGNTREGQATRSKPKNLIRPERASLREQKQPCERSEHPDERTSG